MLPLDLPPCALAPGPHRAVPVTAAMTATPAANHRRALTPAGRRARRLRRPASIPARWAAGTKRMLTRAAPRTVSRSIMEFALVMQLPAGGWVYWMLSDPMQLAMVPAWDSARAPTAATAAPTMTLIAT